MLLGKIVIPFTSYFQKISSKPTNVTKKYKYTVLQMEIDSTSDTSGTILLYHKMTQYL